MWFKLRTEVPIFVYVCPIVPSPSVEMSVLFLALDLCQKLAVCVSVVLCLASEFCFMGSTCLFLYHTVLITVAL